MTETRFDGGSRFSVLRALEDNASRVSEQPFVDSQGQRLTYGELGDAISAFANVLRAAGVRRGEHVMILMANSPEYLIAEFGIMKAACVYVTCSTLIQNEEVEYQIDHSDTVAVVTDQPDRVAAIVAAMDRDVSVISAVRDGETIGSGIGSLGGATTWAEPHADNDDLAMLIYTSGTTARPKGVMYTHGQLYVAAQRFMHALQYAEGERILHYFPMYHGNGGVALLMPIILVRGTIVLKEKFSASRFSEMLAEDDITFVGLNASHAKMILAQPPTEHDRAHRVRRAQFALQMDFERRQEFERRFGIALLEIYGLTECLGIATASPPFALRTMGSAGTPLPGLELRIVDADGVDVPRGSPGEVLLRSLTRRGLSSGYYRDDAATAELMRNGWMHTGDVGFLDDDCCFTFLERSKDMIKRSGFNVAAAEVERVLLDHDSIEETAVVSIPDPFREESIVAYVVSAGGADIDLATLRDHCAARLAAYKVPEHIVRIEQIPTDVLGKVDKKALRRRALDDVEQPPAVSS